MKNDHLENRKWSFYAKRNFLIKNWPFSVKKACVQNRFNLLDSFFGFGVSSNDVILLSPELECPDTSSDTKFEFDEFESDTLPESVDDRVGWVPLESDWLESTKVVN